MHAPGMVLTAVGDGSGPRGAAETLLENAAEFLDSANDAAEAGSLRLRGVLEKLSGVFGGGDSSGSTSSGGTQQPVVLAMDAAGRKILARGIINDLIPEINKKT